MVIPNSGNIQFKNESILGQHLYRSEISHVPQIVYFPENLTPRELIQMAKDLRPGKTREANFIELFELSSEMNKKMSTLSGGTRQKINLLLGLMHDNQVIVLDEPSNGLDPVSFLNLKSFLKQEGKNKQILITTHTMSFVEEIADSIVFLLNGQIYFQGKLTDLLAQEDRSNLEAAIANIIQQKKSIRLDA
jgi:Cu-processing system ATP-binding protein